jgi:hypothetical protein
MKYVILIMETEAARALDSAAREEWMAEIGPWYEKTAVSGNLADGGAELDGVQAAKTIRAGGVTDGPYIEAKEVFGGYSVLEADSVDEAVEIAKGWPGVDRGLITIEVRPVIPT